jgi:hypothetical protein
MVDRLLSQIRHRTRALFSRSAVDRELDDELRFHIERATQRHIDAGLTPSEAARRARIELGGFEQVVEDTRRARGVQPLEALLQDMRYGWRSERARPGFAAAVVLTLGLGLGANTAMFGIVDRLLLLLDFFDLRPALGRFFAPAEDIAPSGTNVAVLGHAFWHSGTAAARRCSVMRSGSARRPTPSSAWRRGTSSA